MKLTIISEDGAVYKDGLSYSDLNLVGIPLDVHALQWKETFGWIEYVDNVKPNEEITKLPSWAKEALLSWQVAYDKRQVESAVGQDTELIATE
jgi:hypothetical protein